MRPTRRTLLAGLSVLGLGAVGPAPRARADLPGPIRPEIRVDPVSHFGDRGLVDGLYGRLRYRGGIELQAPQSTFGGLSSLALSEAGDRLVAVSDHGYWFVAAVIRDASGVIAGLDAAVLAPLLGPDGELLWRQGLYDAEALTIVDGVALVGFEQQQVAYVYDVAEGVGAHGRPLDVPVDAQATMNAWPGNNGLETLFVARAPSPFAGAVVAVAERSRGGADTPTQGVVLTGPEAGAVFDVARSDGFAITDAEVLPGGDVLLLERRYALTTGVAARIRRIAAATIAPGALLDGPLLFEADWTNALDNMEGLAVHRGPQGETLLTIVSDDNYSILQRTLLLEFELVDD